MQRTMSGTVRSSATARCSMRAEQARQRHRDDARLIFSASPSFDDLNSDLAETLELDNMARPASVSLHWRSAGRKAAVHMRGEDFSKRDDQNWLKHTFCWLQ